MKKILMGGGYVAPEMTLYATPVEQGFNLSPGDGAFGAAGYAGGDLGGGESYDL